MKLKKKEEDLKEKLKKMMIEVLKILLLSN